MHIVKRFNLLIAIVGSALVVASSALADSSLASDWDDQPVLVAGEGFDEATTVELSSEVVADRQANPMAIARWNVVPMQQVEGKFAIGVLAWHISGMADVKFSVNGGPWATVEKRSVNPRTGSNEFWVFLDALKLPAGRVEVRAIAEPNSGQPRILQGPARPMPDNGVQSLWLLVNHDDKDVQRIAVDSTESIASAVKSASAGGVIELAAGVYDLEDLRAGAVDDGWITIQPQHGVSRDEVILRPSERRVVNIRVPMLRLHDVTLDLSTIQRLYASRENWIWFDACRLYDSSGWTTSYERYFTILHPQSSGYMTDCLLEDMTYGAVGMDLVRRCTLKRISGDAFQNSKMVVDSTLFDMDSRVLEHHSDVFQYWASQSTHLLENRIVSNVTAKNVLAQHLFMRTSGGATFRDFAFVDIAITQIPGVRGHMKSQLYGNHEHVLFRNVKTALPLLLRRPGDALPGEGYVPSHVLFENCAFTGPTVKSLLYGGHGITTRDLRVHDDY